MGKEKSGVTLTSTFRTWVGLVGYDRGVLPSPWLLSSTPTPRAPVSSPLKDALILSSGPTTCSSSPLHTSGSIPTLLLLTYLDTNLRNTVPGT